jgi:hypothetical protein
MKRAAILIAILLAPFALRAADTAPATQATKGHRFACTDADPKNNPPCAIEVDAEGEH